MPTTLPGRDWGHDAHDRDAHDLDHDDGDHAEDYGDLEEPGHDRHGAPWGRRRWRDRLVELVRGRAFLLLIPTLAIVAALASYGWSEPEDPSSAVTLPAPPVALRGVDLQALRNLPPAPGGVLPEAPSLGATASTVAPSRRDPLVLDALGSLARMPTRPVTVTAPGWAVRRDLSPFQYGVAADGKVVDAIPAATALVACLLLVIAAGLAGALVGTMAHGLSPGARNGYHAFYADRHCLTKVAEGAVMAGILGYASTYDASYPAPYLMGCLIAACLVGGLMDWRNRTRLLLTVLGLGALTALMGIPMVPPHADLVASYGPLGLHAWDIVATAALALAALSIWLPRPRQRITYVTVAAPSR